MSVKCFLVVASLALRVAGRRIYPRFVGSVRV